LATVARIREHGHSRCRTADSCWKCHATSAVANSAM
jgi:hypothetical protein